MLAAGVAMHVVVVSFFLGHSTLLVIISLKFFPFRKSPGYRQAQFLLPENLGDFSSNKIFAVHWKDSLSQIIVMSGHLTISQRSVS